MPRPQASDKSRAELPPLLAPAEREGMPFNQLPLKARLRFEHPEMWVAWAPDEQGIVASGDDYGKVREAATRAGYPGAFLEWVPPVTGAIWK